MGSSDLISSHSLERYGTKCITAFQKCIVALCKRGVIIAERTVTNLLARYEELVTLHLTDQTRLRERLTSQGHIILALDGLQPDIGHEVLWDLRDCLEGVVLVARSLLGATENDLVPLTSGGNKHLPEVGDPYCWGDYRWATFYPQCGSLALPDVPHQLCHFHYLYEAAKPIADADRHAKKELKKYVRGVRPIERALEGRTDEEAEAVRGYCLAVRSALTDDGRPPLSASGLKLHEHISHITASLARVS
jgi:hypothetical protein